MDEDEVVRTAKHLLMAYDIYCAKCRYLVPIIPGEYRCGIRFDESGNQLEIEDVFNHGCERGR